MKKILLSIALIFAAAVTVGAQNQVVRAFSHRGGRMEYDENTLSAFEASRDMGYTGYETDIRMTKDGVLIITHDNTLDRTTNGHGKVEEKTWDEIRQLETKGGHKILTLDEFMQFLKGQKGLYVEFEMKTKPEADYPEEDGTLARYCDNLYETVMKNKPADAQYLFTSSDGRPLRYLQQKHPGIDLLLIVSKPVTTETIYLCKTMGIPRLGAKTEGTSREAVKAAHDAGLIVSLWPTHKIEDFILGCYLGADYLCTDIPGETMKFMGEKMPWINVVY